MEDEIKYTYVITGEVGEYSDHVLWLVAATDNEDEAEEFAASLQRDVDALRAMYSRLDLQEVGWAQADQLENYEELVKALEPFQRLDPLGFGKVDGFYTPALRREAPKYEVTPVRGINFKWLKRSQSITPKRTL